MHFHPASAPQKKQIGLLALSLTSVLGAGCSSIGSAEVSSSDRYWNNQRFVGNSSPLSFACLSSVGEQIAASIALSRHTDILKTRLITLRFNPIWQAKDGPRLLIIKLDSEGEVGQFTAKLMYAKDSPGDLLNAKTFQIGPELIGAYLAKDGTENVTGDRELILRFDSFIAEGQINIMQPKRAPSGLVEDFVNGGSPLAIKIRFRPSLLGKILGLKHVAMIHPLTTQVDGNGRVGDNRTSLGEVVQNSKSCFEDEESCAQVVNGNMLVDSELQLRCHPEPVNMTTVVEDWLPTPGRVVHQKVVTAIHNSVPRRVVAVSESFAFYLDFDNLRGSKKGPNLVKVPVNELQGSVGEPALSGVSVITHQYAGAKRRVEFWDSLLPADSERFVSFLLGVTFAEEQQGVLAGALFVRVLKDPKAESLIPGCIDYVMPLEDLGDVGSQDQVPAQQLNPNHKFFKLGEKMAMNAIIGSKQRDQ